MSLKFEELQAQPIPLLDINRFGLQWSLQGTIEPDTEFSFSVERSTSPSGPWKEIASGLTNTFYVDDTVNRLSKNRVWYYRVKASHDPTGREVVSTDADAFPQKTNWEDDTTRGSVEGFEEITSGTVKTFIEEEDLVLLEIVRRNNLLLRRFIGVPTAIRKQRRFGVRCGLCWDDIMGRTNSTYCPNCYGSGFEGGYLDQINTFVKFEPKQKNAVILDSGEAEPHETQAWMSNYPLVEPRDLLVDRSGRRWLVKRVTYTEKRRFPSRQMLSLREINPSDKNKMSIPIDDIVIPEDSPFVGFFPKGGSGLL